MVFGLVNILVFGAHAHGEATFSFTPEFAKVTVPNLTLAAAVTCYVCGAVSSLWPRLRRSTFSGSSTVGRVGGG